MAKKVLGGLLSLCVIGGLTLAVYLLINNKIAVGYNNDYEPTQPIPYSHALHAGKLKIDCQYCHTTASVSRHASIPPLNVCMNCHMSVRQVNGKDSPHIAKLVEDYEKGESIQWAKVHLLPDHVKFNHAPHVKRFNSEFQCQTCHGQIQEMEVVKQQSSLSMGWCVNCHRQPENNASINCGTCHY